MKSKSRGKTLSKYIKGVEIGTTETTIGGKMKDQVGGGGGITDQDKLRLKVFLDDYRYVIMLN